MQADPYADIWHVHETDGTQVAISQLTKAKMNGQVVNCIPVINGSGPIPSDTNGDRLQFDNNMAQLDTSGDASSDFVQVDNDISDTSGSMIYDGHLESSGNGCAEHEKEAYVLPDVYDEDDMDGWDNMAHQLFKEHWDDEQVYNTVMEHQFDVSVNTIHRIDSCPDITPLVQLRLTHTHTRTHTHTHTHTHTSCTSLK